MDKQKKKKNYSKILNLVAISKLSKFGTNIFSYLTTYP